MLLNIVLNIILPNIALQYNVHKIWHNLHEQPTHTANALRA